MYFNQKEAGMNVAVAALWIAISLLNDLLFAERAAVVVVANPFLKALRVENVLATAI